MAIVGGRYGSGITEAEYQRARQRNLPCLIYLKANLALSEETPEARQSLSRFLDELRRDHLITSFSSADDLAARVTADLHRWLLDTFLGGLGLAAPTEPGPEAHPPPTADSEDRDNLGILRDRVKEDWIAGVLEQSVHSEAILSLIKTGVPEAVSHPWEMVLDVAGHGRISCPPDQAIAALFKGVGRFLLILGEDSESAQRLSHFSLLLSGKDSRSNSSVPISRSHKHSDGHGRVPALAAS